MIRDKNERTPVAKGTAAQLDSLAAETQHRATMIELK